MWRYLAAALRVGSDDAGHRTAVTAALGCLDPATRVTAAARHGMIDLLAHQWRAIRHP
jgi:hypothetical protein